MINTLLLILKFHVSSFANRFIYFLQKLPLLGRLIGDHSYSRLGWKRAGAVIASILMILWGFLSHLLYIGLVIYLPIILLGDPLTMDRKLDLFWHILFILSFVVAGVSSTRMLEPKRGKYIIVKLMRLPATRYMKATLGYRYTAFFIQMIPALLWFSSRLGASWIDGILAAAMIVLWRVFCEYAHLRLFRRTGTVLITKYALVWTVIFAGYAAAFAPLFVDLPLYGGAVMFSLPFMLICLLLGVSFGIVLMRRTDYTDVVDAATRRDDPLLDLNRMMSEARSTAVQAKDSDYDEPELADAKTAHENKAGYSYINAIFFARHRSLIRQPFYKRLAITAGLGAVLVTLGLLFPGRAETIAARAGALLPMLIIVMAFLTVGENICKALFYHCDLKLLRYHFYRRDAVKHYRIRLGKILTINVTIGILLALMLTLALYAAGGFELETVLLIWVCVLALSVFFSVHNLMLYYIFQPYTSDLNTKNPFFYLFGWVVSGLFVVAVNVKPNPIVFTAIAAVVSLVYFLVSFALVRRFAPRNFKIK
ncbi:hypothetical protein [Marinicrinis lubricantis]|uniref:ABC transporter permease n=1 Tax=Marinicrinis lubricantis TaxID=2086470 RepID=A0ABW1IVD3_9BACL